jgi:hypothetical protein
LPHNLVNLTSVADVEIGKVLDVDTFRLLLVNLEVVVLGYEGGDIVSFCN